MVTPFHRNEKQSINYEATNQLVEHLIAHHLHGIFVLGTNGEFHVVSQQEKLEFTAYVVKLVNKRIPVFSGMRSCCLTEAIEMAKNTAQTGADALSLLLPYYLKPSNMEIIHYIKTIAGAVNIPIILYNIPKNTGYNLKPEVLDACLEAGNVIGIKDSSGDTELLKNYLTEAKKHDKDVWVGSDSKIKFAYEHGAIGAIAGTSNLITDTIVGLYVALCKQDEKLAQKLQQDVEVLRQVLPLGTVPSVLKRSIKLAPVGPARLPVFDIQTQYDDKLLAMFHYYGLGE